MIVLCRKSENYFKICSNPPEVVIIKTENLEEFDKVLIIKEELTVDDPEKSVKIENEPLPVPSSPKKKKPAKIKKARKAKPLKKSDDPTVKRKYTFIKRLRTTMKEPQSFICFQCGKIFSSKGCLTGHEKTHLPKHRYICDLCGGRYNCKGNIKAHIKIVHLKIKK